MHLDTGQTQRLLHGELHDAAANAHVAECSTCRAALARAQEEEAEVFTLLRALDRPAAELDARALLARLEPRPRFALRGIARWAAAFLLMFGVAGVAYAMPGSPVRDWIDRIGRALTGTQPVQSPSQDAPGAPTAPVAPPRATSGIAVAPGRQLRIEIITAPASGAAGEVVVSLTDASDVSVLAPTGTASFESASASLRITVTAAGTLEIRIPRNAPNVELVLDGTTRFTKTRDRVTTSPPVAPTAPWRFAFPAVP